MSRVIFSRSEKTCLKQLINKYKLNCTFTFGTEGAKIKQLKWKNLVEEFNSIDTNNEKTEAQLKMCWNDMKKRQKSLKPKTDDIIDPLMKVMNEAMQFSIDGDCTSRLTMTAEELALKKEMNNREQQREDELHRLRLAEQEWLLKAAQEKYHTAQLKREYADELLKYTRIMQERGAAY